MSTTYAVLHSLISDAHNNERLAQRAESSLALTPSVDPNNELAGLLREIARLSHSQSLRAKKLLALQPLREENLVDMRRKQGQPQEWDKDRDNEGLQDWEKDRDKERQDEHDEREEVRQEEHDEREEVRHEEREERKQGREDDRETRRRSP
jgi:hypothetical protein